MSLECEYLSEYNYKVDRPQHQLESNTNGLESLMESWCRICNPGLQRNPGILRIFPHTTLSESTYFIYTLILAIQILRILSDIFAYYVWNP